MNNDTIRTIEKIRESNQIRLHASWDNSIELHGENGAVGAIYDVDRLLEVFRWRKLDEERPPVNKVVLIRTNENSVPITGRYFPRYNGAAFYYWVTPNGRYELFIFPEWREI